MTLRQRILKNIYPLFIWSKQRSAREQTTVNKANVVPPVSFYSLSADLGNGKTLPFSTLRGKKVLLVNTASDCGYTPQYADLQKLYQQKKGDLEIIAFPANDFKEQERNGDEAIASFCARNYGVDFPLAKKSVVMKDPHQHPVFQWLTTKALNGWNDKAPSWNFSKYLVSREGTLTHYFEPAVSPLSDDVLKEIA